MTCDAKIRPFSNDDEIVCEVEGGEHVAHIGVVRDAAYPGSETRVTWHESDRRNFRGDWAECIKSPGCVLPFGHPRSCAQ